MKHAFLIMAHDRPTELATLISTLDNPNHCIYLHIDAHSSLDPAQFSPYVTHSPLIPVKRHKVIWGGVSQILAELELFSAAYHDGGFGYYHLLSGVDSTTHSNEYLNQYFKRNNGKNFIKLSPTPPRLAMRYDQYHLLHEALVGKSRNIWKYADFGLCYIQRAIGIHRFHGVNIPKHQTWCSLTNAFVQHLIQDRDQLSKQFKYTYCCDEIFLTFELLKHNMWDTLSENGSLRFIEWTTVSKHDSSPRILTDRDYEEITSPDVLFARKINFPQSLKLVEHLDEYRALGN